jgi:hypothetical protein
MLRRLAQSKTVLLVIEDVDAIDQPSADLLEHLRKQLPPGGAARLGVILTARDAQKLRRIVPVDIIPLTVPGRARVELMLRARLAGRTRHLDAWASRTPARRPICPGSWRTRQPS